MPGLTNTVHSESPCRRSSKTDAGDSRVSTRPHAQVGSGSPWAFSDSSPPTSPTYNPPYPFQSAPTAYGLNEPQWSVGPPPLRYGRSPYARVPLPSLPSVNLHPLLSGGQHDNRMGSSIVWCVNQPPSSARLSSSSAYGNVYLWKALCAATPLPSPTPPCLNSLVIRVASTPSFTRPIVVFPSDPNSGVITIGDVLNAIYAGLRASANDVLCETMGISPSILSEQVMQGGSDAYTSYSPTRGGDDEVSTHLAQCLGFRTQWVGLTRSQRERDVWVLQTKNIPIR